MAIHINLLAEAQAMEELRRRDPLKRLILGGAVVVVLILVWSSSLMVKTVMAKSDVSRLEGNLNSRTNEYRQILDNQQKLVETKQKLEAMVRLSTNRFLVGNLLNAVQKTAMDNVQLVRLKIDQAYAVTEDVKVKAADSQPPPKSGTATEKIVLTLNARDSSLTGDAYSKFQDALSGLPYFQQALGNTTGFRLSTLGTPQTDPDGKPFIFFTLEARFPERTR